MVSVVGLMYMCLAYTTFYTLGLLLPVLIKAMRGKGMKALTRLSSSHSSRGKGSQNRDSEEVGPRSAHNVAMVDLERSSAVVAASAARESDP